VHLVGFITKKLVMMYGHMSVKNSLRMSDDPGKFRNRRQCIQMRRLHTH